MESHNSNEKFQVSSRPTASRVGWIIAGLALLYTLYFAATLLIPIAVALLVAFLLSPLVGLLARFYVPRVVSALLLMSVIVGGFGLLGVQLSEPAQRWGKQLPQIAAKLNEQVEEISEAIAPQQNGREAGAPALESEADSRPGLFGWFSIGSSDEEQLAAAQSRSESGAQQHIVTGAFELATEALERAPVMIAQIVSMLVLLLFIIVYGAGLYETMLDVIPLEADRRRVIAIAEGARGELSHYVLTISVINLALGMTTALALWLLDLQDPLLWGAMVGLLNFAPYLGPAISVVIISMVGLIQFGAAWSSLLPAAVYFSINFVEAQFVTPAALGTHMRMNPLVIILWLMIWGWLWGFAGVLIAVPLMVCVKLVVGQFPRWRPWLRLIESR